METVINNTRIKNKLQKKYREAISIIIQEF
jgi:hypothetical protein